MRATRNRLRKCGERAVWLALIALVMLALPAFSVAQAPAASQIPPHATPAPIIRPPSIAAPQASTAPLTETDAVTAAPAREPTTIAIVLPLGSATFGAAGEAVLAGFSAAANAGHEKFSVVAHTDGGAKDAFDQAKNLGVHVVVGPLLRDDIKSIASADGDMPWTIALNQLDESTPLPDRIYTLALSIESEGRQLARRIQKEGAQSVAVLASDSPLQKRFAGAFTAEWILTGGARPLSFHFGRSQDALVLLRRDIGRSRIDAMIIAADADDVALAKPYVGQIPAYTSSQVNDRRQRDSRRDLDDVYFIEIPWLAPPLAATYADIPRREFGNASLDRLYALGIDAFHVAHAFDKGPPRTLEFDGATGHLTLEPSRQLMREGILLQFRDGEIVPAVAH